MKFLFSSLMALAISFTVFAQTNPGRDYMALGETELAKNYFEKAMRQAPMESYYYLGQMAFEAGNVAEAKSNFEKGLAANPESGLCAVGIAKLDLKSNPKEASKALNDAGKKNKKNTTVWIEVARAYYEAGMVKEGEKAIEEARKANSKDPYIYIFEGDLLKKQDKIGDAAAQYDQAINFDPNCALAYIKGSQVYKSINRKMSVEMLNKSIEVQPSYTVAYKYLADLSYSTGFYPDAITAYQKYISGGAYTTADIVNLGASQYFTDDYSSAEKTIEGGLQKEPNNFVLNRLMMYTKDKLGQHETGAIVAEKFFSIPRDTSKYITQDFVTYGNILSEIGKKDAAIVQYEKAIELDPSKVELYKEIAITCANEDMDEEAGDFYRKYIEKLGDKAEATDYFQAGRYYYMAGTTAMKDSAARATAILDKADAEFAKVIERKPESYMGHLFRARANAAKDPETSQGLAKPYYDSLIQAIESNTDEKGERVNELKEAYSYLAYYYYLQFAEKKNTAAKAQGREAVEKLLELDPTNQVGLQLKPALD